MKMNFKRRRADSTDATDVVRNEDELQESAGAKAAQTQPTQLTAFRKELELNFQGGDCDGDEPQANAWPT